MLHKIKDLIGCKLGATDGEIGTVKDFYFDDRSWRVRFLVVDTGTWLTGRSVVLAPEAFGDRSRGRVPEKNGVIPVNLNRRQIEDSPGLDLHRPVSRQHEEAYYRHYGWPLYRTADPMGGAGAMPPVVNAPMLVAAPGEDRAGPQVDVHLRSMSEVTGYGIRATDEEIGKVADFVVDDRSWHIEKMVVETGHWFSGKEVLVRSENIERVCYAESLVFVNLSKAEIAETPRDAVAHAAAPAATQPVTLPTTAI